MSAPRLPETTGPGPSPRTGATDTDHNSSCGHLAPVPAACRPETAPEKSDPEQVSARRDALVLVAAARAAGAVDPWQLHRQCPVQFAAYLRETFGGNTLLIAQHFGKSEKTARNWLAGTHAPTGPAMVLAMRSHPEAFAKHLLRAA